MYVSITSIAEFNGHESSAMDPISDILDHDHDVSLDEMLAFIDAYDFSTLDDHDQAVDSTGWVGSIEIEDTFIAATQDAAPLAHSDIEDQLDVKMQSSAVINAQDKPTWSVPSSETCKERGRVRERVVRLRGVVRQLERQLEELTGFSRQKAKLVEDEEHTENSENESTTMSEAVENGSDVVTWQQLAIRQYAARRVAEKENVNLRERLEGQLRVAKRLERLIQGQLLE